MKKYIFTFGVATFLTGEFIGNMTSSSFGLAVIFLAVFLTIASVILKFARVILNAIASSLGFRRQPGASLPVKVQAYRQKAPTRKMAPQSNARVIIRSLPVGLNTSFRSNPASGLPMKGFLDYAGNPLGIRH